MAGTDFVRPCLRFGSCDRYCNARFRTKYQLRGLHWIGVRVAMVFCYVASGVGFSSCMTVEPIGEGLKKLGKE